ncbi:methionyl-tRNA formyltransferase [Alcanivorax sp. 521-1]|uniref:Methionyl-tRNA formyltransferase n=1 Tax=Alloalcanivorax profundimaris TaxID=2735259 RepID=A0ABS0AT29_9GAMM|nr:methionyl-tRNA formyltransferase [Alloalcanivorax profundimaris]MBF5057114.1 methionyl-tRNA formyltransferase [Alloalcanivorax profundimaris]
MSTSPLRLAFAGTPDFAAASLQALIDGPHDIAAVLTQPDRGAGRGKKVVQSPVKQLALAHDLPVLQPESLKGDEIQRRIADLNLDALIVVAYGLIIPRAVLALPRLACVNVHGSLLPRWRGAAPIQWAILAGDTETGNTIMKMDAGLDTGPMLLSEALPIGERETGGELHDRLAEQGARLLSTVLDDLPGHLARAEPQPEDGVTYASKLSKPGARLDFGLPARGIANRVRAFNPWPVAWVELDGQPLRIWDAEEAPEAGDGEAEPGRILTVSDEGLTVACGDGAVRLTRLQLPGKKPLTVADIRRGHPDLFQPGAFLG